MAKYDGLIIPRSYNDYVNKSDPIGVSQALQLTGVMDNVPTAQSTKPAHSGGIFAANAVIMASGATLSGVAISAGSVVRVLITADLTGSDATTGLTLTYNGNAYAVKVGKNGALTAFVASEISSGVFKYLQAYTTLELAFDGSQFVVMGNPVVISNADFSIMADGYITYTAGRCVSLFKQKPFIANTQNSGNYFEFDVLDGRYYYLTVIRSTVIYKYIICYFGGSMASQLLLSEGANPIKSIDLNTTNKCKVTIEEWGYITVMWEEVSAGL